MDAVRRNKKGINEECVTELQGQSFVRWVGEHFEKSDDASGKGHIWGDELLIRCLLGSRRRTNSDVGRA